jgi:ABC-type multidrug transport system fused ATPase/permease subunit
VGVVTQDVQLFQASVRDNLTLFDPSIPDERILAVLEGLGLADWFRSLAGGLDAELASGGKGLSAGEAQLLALTRVFLRDPGLVILDEASSRLDPATERLVQRAVDRLLGWEAPELERRTENEERRTGYWPRQNERPSIASGAWGSEGRVAGRRRTAIVIAHRLATVQRADEILILDGGTIQEHGLRQALAADPHSRFAALLRTGLQEVLV